MHLLFFCSLFFSSIYAAEEQIHFSFAQEKLTNIIDTLAEKRKINILLPQQPSSQEILHKQIITFEPEGRTLVPLSEAWSLLSMFLNLSGFSLSQEKPNLYRISPRMQASTEPLPLFVGTPSYTLPKSEERIRYVYYLRNLKVPSNQDATNPLTRIFKDVLSPGAPAIFDVKTNGFIIVDRADIVAFLVHLIETLDKTGFHEAIEVLPILKLPVQDVVQVFDALKKASGQPEIYTPFIGSEQQADISSFAADTVILGDKRTNYLIMMGRKNNIDRISDFVRNHIDVDPESGLSILHIYDLQFLDAAQFAPILQNIVSNVPQEGQSTQISGANRFFNGVQVIAEGVIEVKPEFRTEEISAISKTSDEEIGISGHISIGGNRLIVAATQDDWHYIKDLIKRLDVPQPQVILEALIADFTYTKTTTVQATVRSRSNSAVSAQGFQFLASNITPINQVLAPNPTQLAQDLLAIIGSNSLPTALTQGTLLVSLNDPLTPGISGLLAFLKKFATTKVLSHPFLLVTNNQKGIIESKEIRRFQGELVTASDSSFTIPIEDVTSTLTLQITPRVTHTKKVILDIVFTEVIFTNNLQQDLTRDLREIKTTATLEENQILAIGGLIRRDATQAVTLTPLLGNIPILGAFFRGVNANDQKTTIILFISPTIIKTKESREGTRYTLDKAQVACPDAMVDVSQISTDPITRIYFRGQSPENLVNDYFNKTNNISLDMIKNKSLGALPFESELPKPLEYQKLKKLLASEKQPVLKRKRTQKVFKKTNSKKC